MQDKVYFNRSPLKKNEFASLPLGAIQPSGWLLEQLKTAAGGLTGQLYKFWDDVKNSAWKGCDGDAWERAPYYLDGLVPLAWILNDAELKKVSMEYIEWTLGSQREDGFFGPETNADWWPRMIMLKVIIQYYSVTIDARVPVFLLRYFRYQLNKLDSQPMKAWAVARCADNMESVVWLYNHTGEPFLLELLNKLYTNTLDWEGHYNNFPYAESMNKILPWDKLLDGLRSNEGPFEGTLRPYYGSQYHLSHVVNAAMGLRMPGITGQFKNGVQYDNAFRCGFDNLMKLHGVAYGMFTGDEHLSGNSPTQGTELCAVVELMYTCETLLTTGIPAKGLGDILEKLAFNALPAAQTSDMLQHQYDQQANQISCTDSPKHTWYNNLSDSNTFGLQPNFGCCTANLHQGWPKYAASLWYEYENNSLACISYAPCTVSHFAGENRTPVTITVETAYPFDTLVRIHVKPAIPVDFAITLRIPEWAQNASVDVNGAPVCTVPGEYCVISRKWYDTDVINLNLPMEARITRWSRNSAAVEVGPLLMAYRPSEEWTKIKEHDFIPDYSVTTSDTWNYGLIKDGLLKTVINPRSTAFGYDNSSYVEAEAVRIPEWTNLDDDCAPTPVDPVVSGKKETIRLVPYGDTCLHITQFPYAVVKNSDE